MKEKSPAFQFYPKDFLADMKVVLMTNEQVGIYIKALSYCWLEGFLPNDSNAIAMLCNFDGKDMLEHGKSIESVIAPVMQCFQIHPDDPSKLIHKRLELEKKKQTENRKKRINAGKQGANARWQTHRQTHSNAIDLPMAKNSLSSSSSSSSSSLKDIHTCSPPTQPLPNGSPTVKTKSNKTADLKEIRNAFEQDWLDYPKRKGANKQKARECYERIIGPDLEALRVKFQAKTKAYLATFNGDLQFCKNADTWFRNWQDIDITGDVPKNGNGQKSVFQQRRDVGDSWLAKYGDQP